MGEPANLADLRTKDVRPVLFVPSGDFLQGRAEEGERRAVGVACRELPRPGDDVQRVLIGFALGRWCRRLPMCGLVYRKAVVHSDEQFGYKSAQHVLQHPASIRAGQGQYLPAVPAVELTRGDLKGRQPGVTVEVRQPNSGLPVLGGESIVRRQVPLLKQVPKQRRPWHGPPLRHGARPHGHTPRLPAA